MKKSNKKGFTIVELVIVIAVIAILAAVLIPAFSNVISKANESKAMQQARNAYTNWLSDGKNAQTLGSGYNFNIQSGEKYYFTVTAGQFSETPHEGTATGTVANVSNGTLTGITVDANGDVQPVQTTNP